MFKFRHAAAQLMVASVTVATTLMLSEHGEGVGWFVVSADSEGMRVCVCVCVCVCYSSHMEHTPR